MSKRAKLLTVSLALAGMVALSIGGVVLAHGPDDADAAVEDCWMQPGWGDHYGYGAICSETASELLGLTPEQIQAQRQAGKSLVEIAEAQGVSEDALIQAILAAKEELQGLLRLWPTRPGHRARSDAPLGQLGWMRGGLRDGRAWL
jgi:hypothetical protein